MTTRRARAVLAALGPVVAALVIAQPASAGALDSVLGVKGPGSADAGASAVKGNGPAGGPVIVMLRDQHDATPATRQQASRRTALTTQDQAPLLADARAHGATRIHQLHLLNAFSATVTAAEARRLAADRSVAAVLPDLRVHEAPVQTLPNASGPAASITPTHTVCPKNPNAPLLEPEALQLTHTDYLDPHTPAAHRLATGAGVTVAYVAEPIDTHNPDFQREDGRSVFVDQKDFTGLGLGTPTSGDESFTDAGAVAAQGRVVHDLSQYVSAAHPLATGCTIRVLGMAPGADLVGLVAFDASLSGNTSTILQALDYAATHDSIDVVNESFSGNPYPDTAVNPIVEANEQLEAAGITVVTSSGDAGPANSIGSPAGHAGITVGASTADRGYAQTTAFGFQLGNGTYASDNISALSSSGVTQGGGTLDLVAPGDLDWTPCTPDLSRFAACSGPSGEPSSVILSGGTSQAAPYVAGAAALVIQAYRATHHGASPSPDLIRRLLDGTATDLDLPSTEQGAGLLDALHAVQAARSAPGGTAAPAGNALVAEQTQLDLTERPGRNNTATVTVRNVGSTVRTLTPDLTSEDHLLSRDATTVTLSPLTDPTFVDDYGTLRSYRSTTFTVPQGTDRLAAEIAWTDPTRLVRLVLVSPHGIYSGSSFPQGVGTYGAVDIHRPAAGTWRAYFWTRASSTGYAGAVSLTTSEYARMRVGAVSPRTATVPAGGTATFRVAVPSAPAGDAGYGLRLAPDAGLVPVVVRTLVSSGAAGGSFAGQYTGGNGRVPQSPAATYAFDVPKGQPDLDVSLHLADPADAVYATLVDPHGEPIVLRTNAVYDSDGTRHGGSPDLDLTTRAPEPGRWRFVFTVVGGVSGSTTSTAFTGRVSYRTPVVTEQGLPDDPRTVLPAGQAVTARISLLNDGTAKAYYFADPRGTATEDLPLRIHRASSPVEPGTDATIPYFLVPTETTNLTVGAHSDRPIDVDTLPVSFDSGVYGDPDVVAPTPGTDPVATVQDPIVAPQYWLLSAVLAGTFDDPVQAAHATYFANASTRVFDRSVVTSTGDPELRAAYTDAGPVHLLALTPGTPGTIRVTITPTGSAGHVVRGTVYVDTLDAITGSTAQIIALPYAYTVG